MKWLRMPKKLKFHSPRYSLDLQNQPPECFWSPTPKDFRCVLERHVHSHVYRWLQRLRVTGRIWWISWIQPSLLRMVVMRYTLHWWCTSKRFFLPASWGNEYQLFQKFLQSQSCSLSKMLPCLSSQRLSGCWALRIRHHLCSAGILRARSYIETGKRIYEMTCSFVKCFCTPNGNRTRKLLSTDAGCG